MKQSYTLLIQFSIALILSSGITAQNNFISTGQTDNPIISNSNEEELFASTASCIGSPFTLFLDASGNATLNPSDIDDGSTSDTGTLELSLSQTDFTCDDIGSHSITLTVNDGNGQTDTCTTTVIVVDQTAPVADAATLADITAECEVTTLTPPTATDNCASSVTVTHDATLPISTQGTTVVTWTYDDGHGNTSTQTQNVIIDDVTAPVADAATLADITAECEVTTLTPPTATDNCAASVTVTHDATLPIAIQGTTVVTWTYDDGHGNTTTQTQNVIIDDVTAPVADAAALADITAECEVTTLTPPTATDNCASSVTVTHDATLPISTQGTTVVTWTYDDGRGNTSTQTQNVIINDVTAPVADAATLADITAECEVTTLTPPTATDNCAASVTVTHDATLPIAIQGTTVVTWTYDDGHGNTTTQTQNVIIDDVTAPVADTAALADITAECEVTILTPPTATDNCAASVTVTHDATLPISTQGTTVVTWTYDDGHGNTSTQTQNVIIDDVTTPVADAATLADITAECEVTTLTPPTATDNCAASVTVTHDAALPISTQGTTVVTWTYDDGHGNTTTQTQNVIIDDVTNPVTDAATLADITAECEVTTLTPPTATDNCAASVTVTHDATFPISTQGTTVVTWTYDDGHGNTTTQTQNVIIDDVTAPVADAATLADITAECEVTTLTPPTATDNCAASVTVTHDATLPISTQGTTVVTWTYDDGHGNTFTQTQNVIIDDVTAPVADAATLADITAECEVTTLTPPTATDNCAASVTVTHDVILPISTQGTTVVTWTYTDMTGNSSIQTQNVIITDATAPIIESAPGDITVECLADIPPIVNLSWTDNCDAGGSIAGVDAPLSGDSCGGTITRTWNITDSSGNAAITRTQIITINDTVAPILATAPADVTVDCYSNIPPMTQLSWTDNCDSGGNVNGVDSALSGSSYNGTITRTWNIADACGNNAVTRTQIITIIDNVAPTFTFCQSNITLNNDTSLCSAVATFTLPTATDNCGPATVVQTDATGLSSGDAFPVGVTTLEFTATDANGNSSVCTFDITVIDNEPPTITCPAPITINADIYCEISSIPGLIQPATDDNCANTYNIVNNLPDLYPLPIGNHYITWTITDSAGLTATCDQLITVVDATPPVISCPSVDPFYTTDPNQCNATLSFTATATDACNGSPLMSYEIDGNPITFPYTFPLGTTTVDAIADDGNGNTSTCNFDVVVEDHQVPTAVCQPLTITLDASGNATIAEDAINNGSTDACGGLTFDTDITNFDCSDIGSNTVELTVTDSSGNTNTCITTITVLDHVQGATATISSNPVSPICQGESVTFTASGTNLGANPNYQWYAAGTPVGTNSSSYTTTSLANGDDVYVEITSGPCATLTTSNTIIMTVNPLRPVEFTLNTSANPACSGEAVDFFITGLINGGTSPTYQWFVNGNPVGSNSTSYTTSTLVDGDIVSVEVSSDLTCANPVPAAENVTITISPDATINLTSANNNQTICNEDTISNITYQITDAQNAYVTGLPSGLNTNYTAGVLTISGSSPQVGTFNYTVSTDGCGTDIATGIITIHPDATIDLISSDSYEGLCNSGAAMTPIEFQLGPGATGATLSSSPALPSGISGSFNAATGVYTISGSTTSVGTYNYTVATIGCGPSATFDGLIKVFNGVPSTPAYMNNSNNIANVCDTPQTINLNVPADTNVESYTWTFYDRFNNVMNNNGFEIISDPSLENIDVIVTADQQWAGWFPVPYTVEIVANNPCGNSSVRTGYIEILNLGSADIEVYTPDDDNGDTDIIYICEGTTSVTMDGYVGGLDYEDWEWDDNGGINGTSGSFSTTTITTTEEVCVRYFWGWCVETDEVTTTTVTETVDSEYTLPSNAQGGDIITISLIGDGGSLCSLAVDDLEIHILETPDAEITSTDTTICEGDSTTITFEGVPNSQIRVNNGSGNSWYNVQSDGTVSLTVSPTTTTTYTLNRGRYHPNTYPGNNNCPKVINGENVTITVNDPPTVTAPSDITICEGDTVHLSPITLGGTNAIGTWSTSGTGTFSESTYIPSATDIFNGTVTLTLTNNPSDGVCNAVSDDMVVTINQAPTAYTGVNQTICADGSVTLSGAIGGSASTGIWSAPSGSFSNVTDLNATYTPSITSGTVTLTLTTNNPSGPCGSTTDTVIITVNPAAIVDAGSDFTVCSSDTITLNGALSGSATSGTWSSSTGGTFENASVLNTTYTPSTTDISNGSVTLTLTSNNPSGVCNPGVDTVVITINEAATVNAGANITTCSSNPVVNLSATSNTAGTWSGGTGTFNDPDLTNAEYTLGAGETSGTVTLTFTTQDPDGSGPCNVASDSVTINITPFDDAEATYLTTINDCSDTTIGLYGNGTGEWSAVSIPPGRPYSFSNINNPFGYFSGESGAEYEITWTLDNPAPCANDTASFTVNFPDCDTFMTFDGSDDSVNFSDNYNLTGNFSIEVWIKPNVINSNIQTILSKRNADNLATGYDLRLVNSNISFRANGSGLSAGGITADRWHHIVVTYNGTNYTLYVDGFQRNFTTAASPTPNTYNMLLGAMSRPNDTPVNYFNGWLDEVRIWDTAISIEQIRQMMNQEIENDSGMVKGSIVPLDISGLTWNNLSAYYQMNQLNSDITSGHLMANVGGVHGILRNMTSHQVESAPLPYLTTGTSTNWDSANAWQNGNDLMIPNTNSVTWNIVSTKHNVTINRPIEVYGLLVDSNKLTIADGNPLTVNKYLKIDGTLDLEGESQLLQPKGSMVDYTGTGKLERDQQGTGNKFNYNYWGSPVSNAGTAGDRTYALASILYDGTNPVSWTTAHNALGTNPATISSRWLYTYANLTGTYAEWHRINQNTGISVGLGFTMKGSGIGNSEQNYTFSGQPNNGTITHTINGGNETLIGNPYPSAIDAHTFIEDNSNALRDGKIIFWEQAPNNPSHILADYRGRYSYVNYLGNLAGTTTSEEIDGSGNASKEPGRYVPVGQGFFVEADSDGGTLIFNNDQRIFKTEASSQSVFLRSSQQDQGQDDVTIPDGEEPVIRRLRLTFKTPEGATRHLLLGFTSNDVATDDVDYGYDALNADYFPSDMTFLIEDENYVIQGVGEFDKTKTYPLSILIGETGHIEIGLTELENFNDAIDVYIYDAVEGTYTKFNDVNFQKHLEVGEYNNRFYLAFEEDSTLSTIEDEFEDVMVRYLHDSDEIYVKTPSSVQVKQLYLINVAGQTVASWNATNLPMSNEIKIPVKHISQGTYILKAETDTSTFNKKIIVKY
ncbi:HYR-like domain-containing protein [Winogradskyella sediminis]|uniref:Por secretion system C-terminal sorting domain-containing protein n=1 Tax=Winogradskyella sediminis TaxID=1382466 RepID=A0A1H1WBG8_9FLAO|nr:HYR domain-containing protein [Winogradskyella sediminis]SDS94577.1 Por secretion system C-terminal sorting domain-containing protein [Winogradskyella sediminis]